MQLFTGDWKEKSDCLCLVILCLVVYVLNCLFEGLSQVDESWQPLDLVAQVLTKLAPQAIITASDRNWDGDPLRIPHSISKLLLDALSAPERVTERRYGYKLSDLLPLGALANQSWK